MTTHAPPTEIAVHRPAARRMGFFTDTTTCIGCKACEVACKQWNDLPADGSQFTKGGSYDHTGALNASTWRHVRFIEVAEPDPQWQGPDLVAMAEGNGATAAPAGDGATVDVGAAVAAMDQWIFMSDVCKHCTNAGCLDACPTGALIRTEFETVVLQPDVCNGCGYCVPACPFGVVAPPSAPSATTASRTASSRRARSPARPTRSSSARSTSSSSWPAAASPSCTGAGWRAPISTARATRRRDRRSPARARAAR